MFEDSAAQGGPVERSRSPGEDELLTASCPLAPSATRQPVRGVLDGAFAVLDALAREEGGLGLTALSRACGLAKSTVYRLAEQLVALGAVQRVDGRYYVGA